MQLELVQQAALNPTASYQLKLHVTFVFVLKQPAASMQLSYHTFKEH
jgi:hypothetical protein